jgi:hypothetical protein
LRRAWKKFWLLVSAVAAIAALTMQGGWGTGGPKRLNELTLARFRPGRDRIEKVQRSSGKFPSYALPDEALADGEVVRRDLCHREQLTISARADGVIQSVVVGHTTGAFDADCEFNLKPNPWTTGRGLRYRDACGRIEEMYGKAESRSPSVKGSDKLELYLYTFDWAGPDVPQVMEVSCDAASQTVTEITLAASSL